MTTSEVRLMDYACRNAAVGETRGIVVAKIQKVQVASLLETAGVSTVARIDRDLDHMRYLGLICDGIDTSEPTSADIRPTALGLELYVRSQGSLAPVHEFFNAEKVDDADQFIYSSIAKPTKAD